MKRNEARGSLSGALYEGTTPQPLVEIEYKGRPVTVADLHLTAIQMRVLTAYYTDGETLAGVAELMGVSLTAVKQTIRKAKRTLTREALPTPRRCAYGSRAELRAALPGVV